MIGTADRMPPSPSLRDPHRCGEAGRETADSESDVWQQADSRQTPRSKSSLIYISWYINGYEPPWTSLDVNLKMHRGREGGLLGHWVPPVSASCRWSSVWGSPPILRVSPGHGAGWPSCRGNGLRGGLGQLRCSCRLFFRLIRVRSPTFAYHHVAFSVQVMNGGE